MKVIITFVHRVVGISNYMVGLHAREIQYNFYDGEGVKICEMVTQAHQIKIIYNFCSCARLLSVAILSAERQSCCIGIEGDI